MNSEHIGELKVIFITDIDLSRLSGDSIRIMALLRGVRDKGFNVCLLTTNPENEVILSLRGIVTVFVPIKNDGGSITNILKRIYALIKKSKEIKEKNSIIIIESSFLAGFFPVFGVSGYLVDVHGFYFSEIIHSSLPSYFTKILFKNFVKFIEGIGIKNASKVITVSDTMKNYVHKEFKVPNNMIEIIPNGYFDSEVKRITSLEINEERGMVTFVGNLAKWANVEKIIRSAKTLRNEKAIFVIVGGGLCWGKLKKMAEDNGLKNVIFTGKLPLDETYEIINRSEIVLLPFSKELFAEVSCPIKLLEYMAFGKAMVIDDVSDISHLLKENNAALVSDPSNENEFSENILNLLNNKDLRKKIGNNAIILSKDFSWNCQSQKLSKLLTKFHEEKLLDKSKFDTS